MLVYAHQHPGDRRREEQQRTHVSVPAHSRDGCDALCDGGGDRPKHEQEQTESIFRTNNSSRRLWILFTKRQMCRKMAQP
jgi:hypothetical protein